MQIVKPADPNLFIFRAPMRDDGTSPPIVDLPGVAVGFENGGSAFYSMWKPSAEEIAAIVAGHPILVGILNNGKPIHPLEISVAKNKDTILEYPDKG